MIHDEQQMGDVCKATEDTVLPQSQKQQLSHSAPEVADFP